MAATLPTSRAHLGRSGGSRQMRSFDQTWDDSAVKWLRALLGAVISGGTAWLLVAAVRQIWPSLNDDFPGPLLVVAPMLGGWIALADPRPGIRGFHFMEWIALP